MAARWGLAGGMLIDAQWDSPFLRSLGAGPLPRERYLPLLARSAAASERTALPPQPLAARPLLAADPEGAPRPAGTRRPAPQSPQSRTGKPGSPRVPFRRP